MFLYLKSNGVSFCSSTSYEEYKSEFIAGLIRCFYTDGTQYKEVLFIAEVGWTTILVSTI